MEKPTILYIYDAMCGWCYGFGPVMKKLQQTYGDAYDFEAVSGGMVRGERIGPLAVMAPYIKTAYKTVEDRTGIRFGEAFVNGLLAEGTVISSSVKPSQAMTAFKTLLPGGNSVGFAHAIQSAFFYDGLDLNQQETYLPLIEPFGVDSTAFLAALDSAETAAATEEEFRQVSEWGVNGFPTVVWVQGNQGRILARGYQSFEQLSQGLKATASSPQPS